MLDIAISQYAKLTCENVYKIAKVNRNDVILKLLSHWNIKGQIEKTVNRNQGTIKNRIENIGKTRVQMIWEMMLKGCKCYGSFSGRGLNDMEVVL